MDSKEEQIKILLNGDPLRYACRALKVKDMRNHRYSEVFNVSRDEVIQYVKEKGLPFDYSHSRFSITDGFKFFEEEGKWYCCVRERGIVFDEKEFEDYDEGLAYITNMLLRMSGTGLF